MALQPKVTLTITQIKNKIKRVKREYKNKSKSINIHALVI
jgi:hypothetical protein